MRDDIICTHQAYKAKRKEEQQIIEMLEKARFEGRPGFPEIIHKEDLGGYKWLLIEHRRHDPLLGYPSAPPEHPILSALFDVKIDEEKGELSGIRIFTNTGKRWFVKYTYNIKQYRISWRAWTKGPAENLIWNDWKE